jgi:predicted nucleic acid-binding protein
MLLCDTNILIEVYRRDTHIRNELEKIGYENIAISDITRAELFYGALNKIELQKLSKDLDVLFILPIEKEISEMAVNLVKQFCLSHKLDIEDALIAATAIYHNIELYTLNIKDFIFIPNIKLYNVK